MTVGNWSVGNQAGDFYAHKEWSGSDGKTETWTGGIRAKWNSYEMYHYRQTQTVTMANQFFPAGPLPARDLSAIRNLCGWSNNDDLSLLDKLAREVRGHSFDLGINLAEAHKSYAGIIGNLKAIGSALLYLKHGNIPAALRTLGSNQRSSKRVIAKDLTGRWLETQYAFLPLVDQAYQSAKALESLTGPRRYKFVARSRTARIVRNDSSSTPQYSFPCSWTYSKKIIADLYENVSTARSLGLTNPAIIAWEVVPYSFVVDWFIPIGTYLSVWGVIPALNGRFLIIERGGGKSGVVGPGSSPGGTGWSIVATRNYRGQTFRFKRSLSSILSVPRPTFKPLDKALSPRHLLNAVALIHQRLG